MCGGRSLVLIEIENKDLDIFLIGKKVEGCATLLFMNVKKINRKGPCVRGFIAMLGRVAPLKIKSL